ncbi:MAG: hypothetical protein QNJ68_17240 [Microcoleaceae cyanobacterium MO_207.B10]|nr:hypothetical protein [Microcoleaceae cyanobacterium MO_207.B10]
MTKFSITEQRTSSSQSPGKHSVARYSNSGTDIQSFPFLVNLTANSG